MTGRWADFIEYKLPWKIVYIANTIHQGREIQLHHDASRVHYSLVSRATRILSFFIFIYPYKPSEFLIGARKIYGLVCVQNVYIAFAHYARSRLTGGKWARIAWPPSLCGMTIYSKYMELKSIDTSIDHRRLVSYTHTHYIWRYAVRHVAKVFPTWLGEFEKKIWAHFEKYRKCWFGAIF